MWGQAALRSFSPSELPFIPQVSASMHLTTLGASYTWAHTVFVLKRLFYFDRSELARDTDSVVLFVGVSLFFI